MAKRINASASPYEAKRISASSKIPEGLVQFSFKYLQANHADYHSNGCQLAYFLSLIARLKDISCCQMSSLKSTKSNPTLRFHEINFGAENVSASGFGIPNCEEFDDFAWQFSISVNAHGRVHGFVIEETFFVVWLDPDHKLYPGQRRS